MFEYCSPLRAFSQQVHLRDCLSKTFTFRLQRWAFRSVQTQSLVHDPEKDMDCTGFFHRERAKIYFRINFQAFAYQKSSPSLANPYLPIKNHLLWRRRVDLPYQIESPSEARTVQAIKNVHLSSSVLCQVGLNSQTHGWKDSDLMSFLQLKSAHLLRRIRNVSGDPDDVEKNRRFAT